MVSEDKPREVSTTDSAKTQKVTSVSAANATTASATTTTVGHGEVGQRTATLYEVRGKVIYQEYPAAEASSAGGGETREGEKKDKQQQPQQQQQEEDKKDNQDKKDGQVKSMSPSPLAVAVATNGAMAPQPPPPSQQPTSEVRDNEVAGGGVRELASSSSTVASGAAGHAATTSETRAGVSRGFWSAVATEDDVTTEERDLISVNKSSSLSFLDWQKGDDSDAQTTTMAVEVDVEDVKTEVVLIDEDDDMSLREKTVTDVSLMDGNAAELVCGRLRSGSTASSSLCKEEGLLTICETPLPPPTVEIKKGRCCRCCCTIV